MPRNRKPKAAGDAEDSSAAAPVVAAAAPATAGAKPAAAAAAAAAAPAAASAQPDLTLVLRTKDDVQFRRVVHTPEGYDASALIGSKIGGGDFSECEPAFSPDATILACSNGKQVILLNTTTAAPVAVIEEPGTTDLLFSPTGSMLVTYRMQDAKNANEGNMCVWKLTAAAPGYTLMLRCGQSTWPGVWWTQDENHFVRRAMGHLMQVHDGRLATKEAIATIDLQTPRGKDPQFAAAQSELPFMAVFVPQIKNSMGYCKVFRLPNVKDELLSRTFGNAADATLSWSPHLNALLVLWFTEGDKTGGSYYGRSSLTVMNMKERESYNVVLGKDDGIHGCRWAPGNDEFIVVHGTMPNNRATLFNSKAQPIYKFGEAPRNYVQWSPDGRLFILGGNGNLAGDTQFYARDEVNKNGDGKLGYYSEKTSVTLWTPDSRAVISANIFTKLRLDNKITFWKHTGEKSYHEKFAQLFTVAFVPVPPKRFTVRPPSPVKQSQQASKPAAYRAPGAPSAAAAMLNRGRPSTSTGAPPKPAGPVGGAVLVEKKKGRR